MREKTETRIPTLQSAIISYIIAQGNRENIEKNLTQLRRYLKVSGTANVNTEQLTRRVETEVRSLESVERDADQLAILFHKDGKMRKERYRHGSAFCSTCGMFKDYHKECPFCGRIEMFF